MQVAGYFRLADQKAGKIIDDVKKSVAGWSLLAEKYKISKSEQAMMAKAFWTD